MVNKNFSMIVGVILAASSAVQAAPEDYTTKADDPSAGIRAGSGAARWQPSLELKATTRSNFYYQSSGKKEVGTGAILTPKIRYRAGNDQHKFDFTAQVSGAAFDTSPRDDYVDGQLGIRHLWNPVKGFSLQSALAAQHGHDPFGVNRTDAVALGAAGRPADARLDIWETLNGSMIFRFGRPEAPVNVEAEIGAFGKIYSNNDVLTDGLEYAQQTGRLAAFFNYSDKTALVLEGIGQNTHFMDGSSVQRDAVEARVRGGVRYQATGKTRADVRVGYFNRYARRAGVADASGLDYTLGLTWAPEEHYNFTLEGGRESVPGYLGAGAGQVLFNNTQFIQMGWNQLWTKRFNTVLSAKKSYAAFELPNGTSPRSDHVYEPNLRATYAVGRNLFLLGSVAYTYRHSNSPGAKYNATEAQAGARYDFF
ncbi:MAG: outer membrane beta-barrel protein [Pseudomonadota bacterium]